MATRGSQAFASGDLHRVLLLSALTSFLALNCSDDDGGDGNEPSDGRAGAPFGGNAGEAGSDSQGGTPDAPGGAGTAGGAPTGESGSGAGGSAGTGATTSAGAGALGASGGEGGGSASLNPTCTFPEAARLGNAAVPEGFCAWEWAKDVSTPRGITRDAAGNVLVIARGTSQIMALWDDDGDGVSGANERRVLATQSGLNHGIALHGDTLYASSATHVYRYAYAADRQPLAAAVTVIQGIPSGGHSTRTLALDDEYLYVSVGSGSNIDANSDRARIRRFPLSSLGAAPVAFDTGEIFADGLRNEVGLRFDSRGRLWGVENGRDDLVRSDLGGDIHQDNPAEELNLFTEPGRFYGYPYCFSEFLLPDSVGEGPGAQWADPNRGGGEHTDAWCKNPDNVVPPVLAMQAHAAPLDMLFYPGGSFPRSYDRDLFVTFHGSWNRDNPTGYKVVHIPIGADGLPAGDPTPFLEYSGSGDKADEWPHRPVGLTTLPNGALLVTSDASNRILAVGHAE